MRSNSTPPTHVQTEPALSTSNNLSESENKTPKPKPKQEPLAQNFDISTPGPYKIYCQSIDPKEPINAIKIAKILRVPSGKWRRTGCSRKTLRQRYSINAIQPNRCSVICAVCRNVYHRSDYAKKN